MAIRIEPPVCLHEKGKRKNNEDSIYPQMGSATDSDKLFLVCDGVGGASKGEVASLMVCDLLSAYFSEHPIKEVDANYIGQALRFVEARMSKHIGLHPECSGMATTLTLLHFNDQRNKATIAWVGDSRIYQVRDGAILFMSDDHSLVNELVKRGEINPEDAAVHPQRNVILRAISGSEQPTKADVKEINNILPGDYFMLCSDGILESIDDTTLSMLLPNAESNLDTVKLQIRELCEHLSNDNFSMYLLRVAEVSPVSAAFRTGELKISIQDLPSNNQNTQNSASGQHTTQLPKEASAALTGNSDGISKKGNAEQNSNRIIMVLAGVALLAALTLGIYLISSPNKGAQYKQYLDIADSLSLQQQWKEAETYYQKAAALFPQKEEAQKRIEEVKIKIRSAFFTDSVKQVGVQLLADTVYLYKMGISRQSVEEYVGNGDTAILRNIRQTVDSLKSHPEASLNKIIEQNATPKSDSAK